MSDLTTFRDHARAMSTAQHKGECAVNEYYDDRRWGFRATHPDPACPGCVTDADRALWTHLADEVDAYLGVTDEEAGLFG